MATIWQEFKDTIEGMMSVKSGMFIHDIRFLMILPLIPFFIILPFVEKPSTLGNWIGIGMILIEIPWAFFLLQLRAKKKENWVDPQRYSDDTNGY